MNAYKNKFQENMKMLGEGGPDGGYLSPLGLLSSVRIGKRHLRHPGDCVRAVGADFLASFSLADVLNKSTLSVRRRGSGLIHANSGN